MKHLLIYIALSLFILVGCEAPATPLAVVEAPTLVNDTSQTEEPDNIQADPVKYGIATHTLPYIQELQQLEDVALIIPMSENPDLTQYDIAVAYGSYEGWQETGTDHQVAIIFDNTLPPLNDPDVIEILKASLHTGQIVQSIGIPGIISGDTGNIPASTVRTRLANLGYPDGLLLTLYAENIVGKDQIIQGMGASTIDVLTQESSGQPPTAIYSEHKTNLFITAFTNSEQRQTWETLAGTENIIVVATLPISYVASPDVPIEFTKSGWPIPIIR